ncbi:SIMPL domain-containing protein [Agrilutibacter solisilvae]|uniref:SIMPL domain-containing protein n=1 Tax=Agrilutibacter solisilvae TaxID=2763317 RepID=A0A975ARU3_9GAMM|nr:SIMPL domain-containing protein [Lysobacter solisilvae]QSX78052.1 SIMPL domain-containing protein [Lysobacter solisilvae]
MATRVQLLSRTAAASLLGLALLANTACSRQDAAESESRRVTLVTVSAAAEARRAPDIATLSTGVLTLAPDANGAIRRNAEQMTRVVAAIRAAGIAAKDVQTSGVSLNPDYQYLANRPPRIKGYYASNTVNVTVRDIGRLGGILDALVATGANQINGPTFDIEDKDAVLDEARGKALDKARARAEGYAKRLGLRVRRVISVDETGGRNAPGPVYARAVMMEQAAAGNASAPIAPGENVLGLSLDVVYELGK